MPFEIDRTDIELRFREVRSLLSYIKTGESNETPPVDTEETKILRGLFFVHLYGAFEKSVNESIQAYLRALSSLGLVKKHAARAFWPTAFDPQFKSLHSTFSERQWKKRIVFLETISSDDMCQINDGAFSEQLQNVWKEKISDVISYLGLDEPAWQQADPGYLDEVVNKRNQVAHGRSSPLLVGSSGRSEDLEVRFEAVYRILDALINCLEDAHQRFPYIGEEYRQEYSFSS